jgi:hypothetical protein
MPIKINIADDIECLKNVCIHKKCKKKICLKCINNDKSVNKEKDYSLCLAEGGY